MAKPALALRDPIMMEDEEQLDLFDARPFITPAAFARAGSQRWIQVAVERAPHLLLEALRPSLQLGTNTQIQWRSPRAADGFHEYRDEVALRRLGIRHLPHRRLENFWPHGGPQWDALGKTSDGKYLYLEAKAHAGEIFTPATQAKQPGRKLIEASLAEAREFYVPGSQVSWSHTGYQYGNRLAFHYLLHTLNGLPGHLIFLYFTNAGWIPGPDWGRGQTWRYGLTSEAAWQAPIHRLHARLGLSPDFQPPRVHKIFMDVEALRKLV